MSRVLFGWGVGPDEALEEGAGAEERPARLGRQQAPECIGKLVAVMVAQQSRVRRLSRFSMWS